MTEQVRRRGRRLPWLEISAQDLRQALRVLRKSPGFTLVAVFTLALGIGVNVAIFSLFEQVLLRALAVPEPARLVNLNDPGPKLDAADFAGTASSVSGGPDSVFSYPMFRDLERAQEPFADLAAHRAFDASLSTGRRARPGTGIFVSGSYFRALGLEPALGRLLGPEDDRVEGQAESAVLSHAYWQRELGGDPAVLGRTLVVNGVPLMIVGVAPRGFHGTTVGTRASVFVPITIRAIGTGAPIPNHDNRSFQWAHLFARLAPGVTRAEAEAAIDPLYRAILSDVEAPLLAGADAQDIEAFRTKSLVLEPGARGQTRSRTLVPTRNRLQMLLAASGLVLLLCCANVAGLMLVRGAARSGEMALRASMGASRARLASLLLAESLLLALPAAVASLPVALLTLRVAAGGVPGLPAAAFDVTLSFSATLFAMSVAVVSALAFGLLPVRDLMRTEVGSPLQTSGARHTPGKRVTRFRSVLSTAQIALSMALVAVTLAFAQSLANIARIDLGLDVDSVVMFSISPASAGHSREGAAALLDRLGEQLEAIPGVSSVASSAVPLLSLGGLEGTIAVEGLETDTLPISMDLVSPDYFRMFGIELLAGRAFSDTDAARQVAVVNERFAERLGLGRDLVGRRIVGMDVEVIGIVADATSGKITGEIGPQVYRPVRHGNTFYVRGARRPEDLMSSVRETVARVDPIVPITSLRTMQQQIRENVATERYVAGASTAFAVLATALAALGLYGALAYSVAQRSREIGLRVALGARPGRIRGMVVRQVAVMAFAGIALGVAAAWLLGRAAQSLLFGVEAGAPLALAGAAAVLAAVTLGAAYLPARRASRVDPMSVLRHE